MFEEFLSKLVWRETFFLKKLLCSSFGFIVVPIIKKWKKNRFSKKKKKKWQKNLNPPNPYTYTK